MRVDPLPPSGAFVARPVTFPAIAFTAKLANVRVRGSMAAHVRRGARGRAIMCRLHEFVHYGTGLGGAWVVNEEAVVRWIRWDSISAAVPIDVTRSEVVVASIVSTGACLLEHCPSGCRPVWEPGNMARCSLVQFADECNRVWIQDELITQRDTKLAPMRHISPAPESQGAPTVRLPHISHIFACLDPAARTAPVIEPGH